MSIVSTQTDPLQRLAGSVVAAADQFEGFLVALQTGGAARVRRSPFSFGGRPAAVGAAADRGGGLLLRPRLRRGRGTPVKGEVRVSHSSIGCRVTSRNLLSEDAPEPSIPDQSIGRFCDVICRTPADAIGVPA
jgi:hypothetical protein